MPPDRDDYREYTGPERRVLNPAQVADMVAEELDHRLAETESRLIQHFNAKCLEISTALMTKMDSVANHAVVHTDAEIRKLRDEAFPEGPLYRHKDFHDGRIKQAQRDDQIKTDLYSWLLRGAIGLVGAMVLLGFIEWLKREMNK